MKLRKLVACLWLAISLSMYAQSLSNQQTQATFNSPATPTTVTNFQYSADGTVNPACLQPQTAGFGAVTGAYPPRSAQLQVRFQF